MNKQNIEAMTSGTEKIVRKARLSVDGSTGRMIDLVLLFASKFGVMIVGVLFLPIFHRLLGNEAFGVAAVILSLLAFTLFADFGMATLVGRDLAHFGLESSEGLATLLNAKYALIVIYGGLLVLTLTICAVVDVSAKQVQILIGCILLFLMSVLQNLELSAILARKHFVVASTTQTIGSIGRALITVGALEHVSTSLLTFIAAQATAAAVHFGITWYYRRRLLRSPSIQMKSTLKWRDVYKLISRGRALMIAGLAGASVLQLDKTLLSVLAPAGEVSPYFLAMSFSALPAALLASPIVQYFQPQLINAIASRDNSRIATIIHRFTLALILVVALPSWIIWQWMEIVITLWLRNPDLADIVTDYVKILLPAFVVGSLCYVPVVLLLAVQDFKYQAFTSFAMTVCALSAVAIFASAGRIDWVCYVYFFYFLAASISVWYRSFVLTQTRKMARLSAITSFVPLASLITTILFFTHVP